MYYFHKIVCIDKAMKTTLDLPSNLLEAAMRASGCDTKTGTIVLALEQLVRREKLARLRALRGTMPDLAIDIDTLRGRKSCIAKPGTAH